jgi:hypothetical protein
MRDDDDDPTGQAKPLREMVRDIQPGDRWPYEPPAPDVGPDGGVGEPRTPRPSSDPDAAEPD